MIRQLLGDCRVTLPTLDAGVAQSVITSPPYYGLRDYGTPPLVWGQTCCDHPHEWGAAQRAPWANELPSAKSETRRNNAFHDSMGKTAGAFCQHVHEWATVVKPAANGIVASAMQGETLNGTSGTRKPSNSGMCSCGAWLGSLGLEPSPELYIEHIVECFRHVRRGLRDDGVLWLNLGDSYAGSGKGPSNSANLHNPQNHEATETMKRGLNNLRDTPTAWMPLQRVGPQEHTIGIGRVHGYKPKDLMMMPFRVAMALQADGWWLRSVIPWVKRNSMPESVTDRPATSVEYVFLLAKSARYYWDADSVRSGYCPASVDRAKYAIDDIRSSVANKYRDGMQRHVGKNGGPTREHPEQNASGRNRRNSDWFLESWQGLMLDEHDDPLALVVNPMPFSGAHFATFPARLIEPMVKASTSEKGQCPECGAPWARTVQAGERQPEPEHRGGVRLATGQAGNGTIGARFSKLSGQEQAAWKAEHPSTTTGWRPTCAHTAEPVPQTILDPFSGAGTVGLVADRLGRNAVLCELKDDYGTMAHERITGDAPMFTEMAAD